MFKLRRHLKLATAILALGCSAAAQAGEIKLGMTTWVGYGPLFLARDLGYFKEEGVDVELTIIEESALYMAAVAGGTLNGAASTLDDLMKYRSPELCFKFVAALDDSHGGDGVLTQANVTSLKDLKGKEVALNEGSVSEFWFNILLKREGLSEGDVKVTNMTADDAAAAFIAGRVPAAVTWEPHLTAVRKRGEGKVLIDSSSTPGLIVDVLALTCDVIEKQPDDVKGLLKGLFRAVEYIKTNQDDAYRIMAKAVGGYLSDPADFAAAAAGVRFYGAAENAEFFAAGADGPSGKLLGSAVDIWGKAGKLKMTIDPATIVDASFLTAN